MSVPEEASMSEAGAIALTRRSLVRSFGLGSLVFMSGGTSLLLTPSEARARQVSLRTLSALEAETLDALGDTLLPGAAAAGLSHYVDQQISGDPVNCLLIARYLGVSEHFADFYRKTLAAVDLEASRVWGKAFKDLSGEERIAFIKAMAPAPLANWTGPLPTPPTYLILRNDAVDVFYGTVEGFDRLEIPYMPHIEPQEKW